MAYRLCIDYVPEAIWGVNLRSKEALGRDRWKKLRQSLLEQHGPKCSICPRTENPRAHEVWEYVERARSGIARLTGIEIICAKCHSVHHWGMTSLLVLQGRITPESFADLIEHACTVNDCTPDQFKAHIKSAAKVRDRRSRLRWRVDWGEYRELIAEAKAARVEWEIRMESAGHNPRAMRAASARRQPVEPAKTYEQRMFDGDGPPPRSRTRAGRS